MRRERARPHERAEPQARHGVLRGCRLPRNAQSLHDANSLTPGSNQACRVASGLRRSNVPCYNSFDSAPRSMMNRGLWSPRQARQHPGLWERRFSNNSPSSTSRVSPRKRLARCSNSVSTFRTTKSRELALGEGGAGHSDPHRERRPGRIHPCGDPPWHPPIEGSAGTQERWANSLISHAHPQGTRPARPTAGEGIVRVLSTAPDVRPLDIPC